MRFFSRSSRGTTERRAASGSDLAEQLLAHWPPLRVSARKLMRDPADAEDLAHDTFERALRSLDRFTPGTNMRAWLYTIMVRLARDHYRRQRSRRTDEIDIDSIAGPEADPGPAWCTITTEQVRAALGEVSPVLRQVFEMHELEQLPYLEIARQLDVPVNTVASRLRRARERLRDLLGEPAVPLGPSITIERR